MVSTFELSLLLAAYFSHVVAAMVSGWRTAKLRPLPWAFHVPVAIPVAVFAVFVGIGALNDTVSLASWAFHFKSYGYLRGMIYTFVEFTLVAMFGISLVETNKTRYAIGVSAMVFIVVMCGLLVTRIQSENTFDNYSSSLSALGTTAIVFCVMWDRARDIAQNQSWRWVLVLCLLVAGSGLLDFTIFFTYNTLEEQGKSLWWVHHCVSVVKYSGVTYCYWRLL
jgi:hypothetical protein